MSANSAAHGTKHFKMHSLSGWGLIISLPFAIISVLVAIPNGADGVLAWLTNPVCAVGMILFLSAAILYAKLEMDEVIMDYASGGMRQFGQLANSAVAFIIWAVSVAGLVLAAFI